MAAEEFQESEVIFADHDANYDKWYEEHRDIYLEHKGVGHYIDNNNNDNNNGSKKMGHKKRMASSLPVNIPEGGIFQCASGGTDDFEDECDDGEIVPPHVIVGRRIAGKMAFSVCTGNGRTLKGRDLSQVRNSVLRMTGFLEA